MKQDRTGAAATTPAAVNSVVGTIRNKGLHSGYATNTNNSMRPILRQSGALYYLEFDGSNDHFDITLMNVAANMTFCRGHYRPAAGANSLGIANGVCECWWGTDNKIGLALVNQANEIETAAIASTGSFVLTSRATGGTQEIRVNGVVQASGACGSPSGGVFYLGRNGGSYTVGGIYSIIGGSRYMAEDLAGMEAHVAAKAGVTLP